ncbi:MAG: alpha/beta hydrolase, partial [Nevskiales bacterium]
NLDEITHRRAGDLFGGVRMNYHRHAMKMANRQRTVRMTPRDSSYTALPYDYLANAQAVTTPCLLVTGDANRVFLNSNQKCHEEFQRRVPGRHQLHVFGNYGHQDIFMGKNAAQDVFPVLLDFLNRHRTVQTG